MKKTLIATTMLIGLSTGFALAPASTVFAQETSASTEAAQQNWLDALNARVDLAQAKAALLRAQIALEIEQSPERAQQALDDAAAWVTKAKEKTVAGTKAQMQVMSDDIKSVRDTVAGMPDEARAKIEALTVTTEARLLEYKQALLDTDEAKSLQMRYAQTEAHAALLQAQLAEKVDATGALAAAYLDKAQALYQGTKEGATKGVQTGLSELSADIDAAKLLIVEKRDQAGTAITDLAERAADFMRGAQ